MEQRPEQPVAAPGEAEVQWFRPPTRREHGIAAALFLGFGLFFVLLFVVLAGWWFRWVTLVLSLVSVAYALSHVADARASSPKSE